MTPLPFWLMIVSSATAVLPVWRSPMISSRWPRPIGTMASIALMPVCSGSLTGWRSTTPGAMRSTAPKAVVAIGPLPSIGWPSAFTTRPTSASPTGTDMMRCGALDRRRPRGSPSDSPNSTAPTESSSRLRARPMTPCGSSSSSPAMQRSRPWMRAMPSPTVSTVPTSATSMLGAEAPELLAEDPGDLFGANLHARPSWSFR